MTAILCRRATDDALRELRADVERHVLAGGTVSDLVIVLLHDGEQVNAILTRRLEFLEDVRHIDERVSLTLRDLLAEGSSEKVAVIGCAHPSHFELTWADYWPRVTSQGGQA